MAQHLKSYFSFSAVFVLEKKHFKDIFKGLLKCFVCYKGKISQRCNSHYENLPM